MKELKSCLAKEKDEDTISNPSSVRSLTCHEALSESPVRHFSAVCESSGQTAGSVSTPDTDKKENTFVSQSDSSLKDSSSVKSSHRGVTADSTDQVGAGEKSGTSLPRKPTIRRVKTVRPTHIPDVPFGRTKPVSLFESLTKSKMSPKKGNALKNPCQSEIVKIKPDPESDDFKHNVKGCDAESYQSQEPLSEKQLPKEFKSDPAGTISEEDAAMEDSSRVPKNDEDSRAEEEKASGTASLLSAANVARRKDGEVVVVWTR